MPVKVGAEIRVMDQEPYKALVYEVMRHVFAVHNELGRLLEEKIYQREIAHRVGDALREVAVEVSFADFRKVYYFDLLVGGGAIFELKAVEALGNRHRSQLLNYLFLSGLPHGKLVNLRPERVEHEFVNSMLTHRDRTCFIVADEEWREFGSSDIEDRFVAMLRDWGTGLDLGLYEEAILHGSADFSEAEIEIRMGRRSLGTQSMRLISPGVALRITALPPDHCPDFNGQLHRFLAHSSLRAVPWINVTHSQVRFRTIR